VRAFTSGIGRRNGKRFDADSPILLQVIAA
jgi:hypothetical protein